MKKNNAIALVICYLLIFLSVLFYIGYHFLNLESNSTPINLFYECIVIGGIGGVFYCLRGVYISNSVKKIWSNEWIVWYFIRPIVSLMCGGISFLFLKAGLLVLEAKKEIDASNLGFFALSFIAGMNVDRFIAKIEQLAKATWGIDNTRMSNKE